MTRNYKHLPAIPNDYAYWRITTGKNLYGQAVLNLALISNRDDCSTMGSEQISLNTEASYSDPESEASRELRKTTRMAAERLLNRSDIVNQFKKWHDRDVARTAINMLMEPEDDQYEDNDEDVPKEISDRLSDHQI